MGIIIFTDKACDIHALSCVMITAMIFGVISRIDNTVSGLVGVTNEFVFMGQTCVLFVIITVCFMGVTSRVAVVVILFSFMVPYLAGCWGCGKGG